MSESQIVAAFKAFGLETVQQREQILKQGIIPSFDYSEGQTYVIKTSTNSESYHEGVNRVAELEYAP
jgi:hypothetical protein